MDKKIKVIRMKIRMADPKGNLIPRGVQETLTIEIADGMAVYWFKDRKVTKRFALIEVNGEAKNNRPISTYYLDRVGKAIKKYEGKTKEEIKEIILKILNELNLKTKFKKKDKNG